MAIYSLHHTPIGKGTQPRRYTAAAHIRYITRRNACTQLNGERMPIRSRQARAWLRNQEDGDRKNARVGDKVLIALPRELNREQRAELVRGYAEEVTHGRASWLAAFHDVGEDSHNPHVHLFIRDRDPKTGKRVCGMSERGSTERLRFLWERHANAALEKAGRKERIDRRTLAAQGIKREPTIHEGLSARDMQARGLGIQSKPRKVRNAPGARTRERVVDYRKFDQGRSRPAHNRRIRETQVDYWAAIDTDDIVRRWQKEDRAKAATARNIVGRLPIEHNPGRSDARLDGIQKPAQPQRAMTRPSHSSKANAMDEEEKRRRYLEHVLREAETAKQLTGGAFLNAVDKSYIDPDKAKERMEKLRQAKGERAVEEKLQNQPGRFGRRPASILSPDGYKRGAGGRREDASEARESLPHLLREYRDQRDRADAAQRALGKQPSFSESLAQRRAGNEPSQQDKAQDKEKERAEQLERWKREREQGRKR